LWSMGYLSGARSMINDDQEKRRLRTQVKKKKKRKKYRSRAIPDRVQNQFANTR
jgi:hypothetical protein